MATPRTQREIDKDIEFGRLLETVANLQKQMTAMQEQSKERDEATLKALDVITQKIARFEGAKGIILFIIGSFGVALGATADYLKHFWRH